MSCPVYHYPYATFPMLFSDRRSRFGQPFENGQQRLSKFSTRGLGIVGPIPIHQPAYTIARTTCGLCKLVGQTPGVVSVFYTATVTPIAPVRTVPTIWYAPSLMFDSVCHSA